MNLNKDVETPRQENLLQLKHEIEIPIQPQIDDNYFMDNGNYDAQENFQEHIVKNDNDNQDDNDNISLGNYQNIDITLQIFQENNSTIVTPVEILNSGLSSSNFQSCIESLLRSCWVKGFFDD